MCSLGDATLARADGGFRRVCQGARCTAVFGQRLRRGSMDVVDGMVTWRVMSRDCKWWCDVSRA
jgi:hypothetical protein